MTGTTWIIDSQRFATKIKNASGSSDPSKQKWISNPSKECPKCSHVIDNSDVVHQWPGLPKGVKFDPSDQELIWHLRAKHGKSGIKPHPFIDEFIPTVEEDEGICYTHPQKLPGVKQNGRKSHFFHRTFKAYNTGTRKRRKINTDDADVRWHKTGKTKPVLVDGKQLGCKKIMVLYMSLAKGGKAEKTNWVMHQYHLGTGEDERDGEYVVSKLFFQQQFKPGDKNAQELTTSDDLESMAAEADLPDFTTLPADKHVGTIQVVHNSEHNLDQVTTSDDLESMAAEADLPDFTTLPADKHVGTIQVVHNSEQNLYQVNRNCEINIEETVVLPPSEKAEDGDNPQSQDPKLWEGDSQFELLDSQQLAEGLALWGDEFLLSQSQTSCGGGDGPRVTKPCLAAYAHLSAEDFKKDLEECQRLEPTDNTNLELDNTNEFRLSQIDFSQDSFTTWAGAKMTDD
ncbi:SUPPRESSOR OF GAMMA RESPONSE 1-like [Miscanthus floridulus]|uniref:SUPPRESSOR OF GAMMA RESPONSE 1-like n=1 Tax=Miscanthus floridulus TaxID=154761 RepID=UPI00345A5E61